MIETQYQRRILIRSRDRISGSASEFELRFAEPLVGSYTVYWITIPNTLYAVNASNNSFELWDGVGWVALQIPQGSYTGAQLAATLTSVFDTIGPPKAPHIIAYSSITGKLTITTADASDTIIRAGATAYRILGVDADADTTIPSGTAAPYPVFLGIPLSLGIEIKEACGYGYTTSGGQYATTSESKFVPGSGLRAIKRWQTSGRQSTLIVPWLAPWGVYNFHDVDSFEQKLHFPTRTSILNIRVIDPTNGEVVDLTAGEWELFIHKKTLEDVEGGPKRVREV